MEPPAIYTLNFGLQGLVRHTLPYHTYHPENYIGPHLHNILVCIVRHIQFPVQHRTWFTDPSYPCVWIRAPDIPS